MNKELLKTDTAKCLSIMSILLQHKEENKNKKDIRECLSATEIYSKFGYKITIYEIELLIDKYLFSMGICHKHSYYNKFLGYSL